MLIHLYPQFWEKIFFTSDNVFCDVNILWQTSKFSCHVVSRKIEHFWELQSLNGMKTMKKFKKNSTINGLRVRFFCVFRQAAFWYYFHVEREYLSACGITKYLLAVVKNFVDERNIYERIIQLCGDWISSIFLRLFSLQLSIDWLNFSKKSIQARVEKIRDTKWYWKKFRPRSKKVRSLTESRKNMKSREIEKLLRICILYIFLDSIEKYTFPNRIRLIRDPLQKNEKKKVNFM